MTNHERPRSEAAHGDEGPPRGAGAPNRLAEWSSSLLWLSSKTITLFLWGIGGVSLWLARNVGGFWRSALLEGGAGLLLGLSLKTFASRKISKGLLIALPLTALALVAFAHGTTSDYWQALLLTCGVSVVLFVGLDVLIARVAKTMAEARLQAMRREAEEARIAALKREEYMENLLMYAYSIG